jgi:hypothetical protein
LDKFRSRQSSAVAAVFAVACAIFHKNVVSARSHEAEAFIALNTGLAHPGTRSKVTPLAVHLLANLSAHRSFDSGQMFFGIRLSAVRDREGAVVEGICTFRI